ncbi:Mor transcription activator family protein [Pelotomaculum propionicicum]|uniref:Mor transcription activator domain-containing protein n=1 Tax=Pelotomaculum propionicicum TaxID=258475 RepID=A0A4Y7RKQ2_9FIRM|nr:Mor transcription activator family protein [Pelotomaculum propionicicum]NLI14569.1 hypothetical protein [Peptococcaceae bacterium]TEB09319.1 hypothetical protein Pmgp_03251 [Pelotomaculum propionicicum]
MNDLLNKEVTLEDLPESYKRIASIIGPENAIQLAMELGGSYLYIPKYDSVIKNVRDRMIRKEFTGFNVRDLAKKYCLSESWIRDILQDTIGSERGEQLKMF